VASREREDFVPTFDFSQSKPALFLPIEKLPAANPKPVKE
jgi:hypothetical protein